jgi:SAM-dependent methyltransferase
MSQNIYDDPGFFAGYSTLDRSVRGLDGAPEWPSLRAMLPPLAGRRVVDLGCGFGWFCRWAAGQGAAGVLGVDLSERMLERARAGTSDPVVTYERGDLERLDLPAAAFEVAYASLSLHYVGDLDRLLATVHRALVPGGRLVASVEHPLFTAPTRPGWGADGDGRRVWPVDAYLEEGPRTTDWLAPGVVKQHRTFGTWMNRLVAAGFAIARVEDWGPTDAELAARPDLADERRRPTFLLLAADRSRA